MKLITLILTFSLYAKSETAIFAGGCFWCMEATFEKIDGVISAVSGYTGGATRMPTYEQVTQGQTGHLEAVEIKYDPQKVSYEKLLEAYWTNIDPFDQRGQFCDKGEQYRSAIFYLNEEQKKIAENSKEKFPVLKSSRNIATAVLPAKPFYPAEDYHQDYYKKNPIRYHFYRTNCGRDARLKEIWHQRL